MCVVARTLGSVNQLAGVGGAVEGVTPRQQLVGANKWCRYVGAGCYALLSACSVWFSIQHSADCHTGVKTVNPRIQKRSCHAY